MTYARFKIPVLVSIPYLTGNVLVLMHINLRYNQPAVPEVHEEGEEEEKK